MIVFSAEKRLDVLVNNAGLMHISKTRQLTADGFELHLGVNYLGETVYSSLFTIYYSLYTTHYILLTIYYSLYTIYYSLFIYTTHYLLYTIHYILLTIYSSLFTIYYSVYTLHRSIFADSATAAKAHPITSLQGGKSNYCVNEQSQHRLC